MLHVLKHPIYRRLFTAQVIALLGTGLLTVALGLLAYDLAGANAGAVLGTAFAIKMLAYVGLSPIAHALSDRLPRKTVLIGADIIRAAVALFLPFIDSIWQIYCLIFILQAASATFTPAFQAIIPDILDDEKDYTNALSLSRLAYDLENLISPALAGLLLTMMNYHWLFCGTFMGFMGSALLIYWVQIPISATSKKTRPFVERLTRGARIYLATPRLRGLLALNLAAAASGAFIIVNTVVIVQAGYGATQGDVALALMAFGGGSMFAALFIPYMLDRITDRNIMLTSSFLLTTLTLTSAFYTNSFDLPVWTVFLTVWALSGLFYAAILTPSGRLLRNSAHSEDRPAIFSAQFALSHACWLLTYPIAGWAGQDFGLPVAMIILGFIAFIGSVLAAMLWVPDHTHELDHEHAELPLDHPHLQKYGMQGARHRHNFVIDDEHRAWPTQG